MFNVIHAAMMKLTKQHAAIMRSSRSNLTQKVANLLLICSLLGWRKTWSPECRKAESNWSWGLWLGYGEKGCLSWHCFYDIMSCNSYGKVHITWLVHIFPHIICPFSSNKSTNIVKWSQIGWCLRELFKRFVKILPILFLLCQEALSLCQTKVKLESDSWVSDFPWSHALLALPSEDSRVACEKAVGLMLWLHAL